jgi:hypothetical protein
MSHAWHICYQPLGATLQKIITEGTRTRLPLPATILAARLGGMATYNHQKHAISGAKIRMCWCMISSFSVHIEG